MNSCLAGLENYRVWFKFELIHWCKWDSEKREGRVVPAIREGFLEERDLIGGSGKGRGERMGRKHRQEATISQLGQVDKRGFLKLESANQRCVWNFT